jgi:hypothetical protein
MQLPECAAPSRCRIALVVALSLAAFACSDQKPGAAPAVSSAAHATGRSAPALTATTAAGSDSAVVTLAGAADTTLAGTPVQLSVAHVQSVMSDHGFWIGVWGQQVYVFQTASRPIPIQGGEAYSVRGTVRVAPHSAQSAPRGMTPIDIEALHAQHIYIAADSVAPTSR